MTPPPTAAELARDLDRGLSLPASFFTDPAVVASSVLILVFDFFLTRLILVYTR